MKVERSGVRAVSRVLRGEGGPLTLPRADVSLLHRSLRTTGG